MMTLTNYGIGSNKHKDPNTAKVLSKCLQIRNRAEIQLKQCLKSNYHLTEEKRADILTPIKDYYSRIPFNLIIWNKYQTKQCIIDSILLLDSKFDPYKALAAFKTLEQMLMNHVHFPWHHEFRKIFVYSGQFRLSVSEPLIGAEEVLKAAGFKQSPDDPMQLVLTDDKMPQVDDGESVTSVIFDCLISQVVLSDIIEIFENCCKAAKSSPDELIEHVNCLSWIQIYFKERSQQTTERASSNLHELFDNMTFYLSKIDKSTARKSPSQSGRLSTERIDTLAQSSSSLRDSSPKLSAQEKTRKFLAEQQAREEETRHGLPSDLLRLQANIDSGKRLAHYNKSPTYDQLQRLSNRPDSIEDSCFRQPQPQSTNAMNGYDLKVNNNQLRASSGSLHPTPDSFDAIDSHSYSSSNIRRTNLIPATQTDYTPVIDPPHDDRELLIPRYDRRVGQQPIQSKRNSYYDNDFDMQVNPKELSDVNHLSNIHWRSYNNQKYPNELASHLKSSSNHHDQSRGSSFSSKYKDDLTANSRYNNLRDSETKSTNSRTYWSCSLCTYNNQNSSEICEMCRDRRPLR